MKIESTKVCTFGPPGMGTSRPPHHGLRGAGIDIFGGQLAGHSEDTSPMARIFSQRKALRASHVAPTPAHYRFRHDPSRCGCAGAHARDLRRQSRRDRRGQRTPNRLGKTFAFFINGQESATFDLPRRRNLWVTDTLQWAPEARLAQPANPMSDSAASAFHVRSQLPFEPDLPSPVNANRYSRVTGG